MDDVAAAHLQARNLHLVVRRQHGITASSRFVPGGRTAGRLQSPATRLSRSPRASLAVADWKTIGGGQAGAAVGEAARAQYRMAGMSGPARRGRRTVVAAVRPLISLRVACDLADDVSATQRPETKKRHFVSQD